MSALTAPGPEPKSLWPAPPVVRREPGLVVVILEVEDDLRRRCVGRAQRQVAAEPFAAIDGEHRRRGAWDGAGEPAVGQRRRDQVVLAPAGPLAVDDGA